MVFSETLISMISRTRISRVILKGPNSGVYFKGCMWCVGWILIFGFHFSVVCDMEITGYFSLAWEQSSFCAVKIVLREA